MDNGTIYTRAYSKSSAGQLVSAKGPNGYPLSDTALVEEFRNHADRWNRKPTALVSGSDRIVDTLKRAFEKHYKDHESSADIWIAFVNVPTTANGTATRIHSAKELAKKCELSDPNKFSHEVVFEWAIPEKYVSHKVSLWTLIKRGLPKYYFLQPSTLEVRHSIAQELQVDDPWGIGVSLGIFAQYFGARAPLDWISKRLFLDCVRVKITTDDVVMLNYANEHTDIVDFQFFCDLDDGTETALVDWWLSDIDFFLHQKEFREWQDIMEDSMAWNLIECWETWHDVNFDGKIKELCEGKVSI